MARPPKPFPYRGGWYTDVGGTRTLLAQGGQEALPRAQRALARMIADRHAQTKLGQPSLTVAAAIDAFLDSVEAERAHSTYVSYRAWLKLLRSEMGHRRFYSVTRSHALTLRDKLVRESKLGKKRYGPRSVNYVLECANRLWNWMGERDETLGKNPFADLPHLPTKSRRRTLTDEEFARLMRAAGHPAVKHFLFALRYTGARPCELRRLTWDDVRFDQKVCVISTHKTSTTSKTKQDRYLPLSPALLKLLEQRRELYGDRSPFVFLSKRNKHPWKVANLGHALVRMRKRAGIVPDANGEMISAYSHRHTFLTAAARAGVTGPQLKELGGWTGLRMLSTYVHLTEADVVTSGARANELLKPKPRPKPGS